MASQQHVKEYVITAPKGHAMQHNIMRFHGGLNMDFDKWPDLGVKMERENNMREFKTFGEDQPKFGAGSEFGREAREEARRKKYGITLKKYKPDDQPWMMKVGSHKTARKYKGTREGGITENASYYIFTPGKNNSFEAYPIKEWYNFIPIQRYKALTEEEAEEQFNRRDRTLNYFAVMVGKKVKGENADKGGDEDGEGKKGKGKGKQRTLKFDNSDFEDSEEGSEGNGDEPEGSDKEKTEKGGKQKGKKGGKKAKQKKGTDSEAGEDSGDGDQEGNEVDYMSSSEESDSDIETRVREELKGVGDEKGLKQLLTSDEESEEEKKSDKEEEDEDQEKEAGKEKGKKDKKKKKKAKKDDGKAESSYSSTTDSEDEEHQKRKAEKKAAGKSAVSKIKEELKPEPEASRPLTPKPEERNKRPLESAFSPPSKMAKMEPGLSTPGSSTAQFAEGLNEETLRRYLARKPMTAVDLLALFKRKKTGLSTDQLVAAITDMLKRINPIKNKHQGKTYFSLRK